MPRTTRKGNIHKVREYELFTESVTVNSLTAKMLQKYIQYINSQATRRLLPLIECNIIDDEIKKHSIWNGIYRRDYTMVITSPEINIGDYRPLKLVQMIKKFQKYENFEFYEAIQPINSYGEVIKEYIPYFKNRNKKSVKFVKITDVLKVAKLIIENYGYVRQKDNQVEGFNWIRTTGEKAFDILTNEPQTEFKQLCLETIKQNDLEINSMLNWVKTSYISDKFVRDYRPLFNKEFCYFEDVNKIVSLIPIYRHMKLNEKIKYFVS